MLSIDICVPTLNRPEQLARLEDSVPVGCGLRVKLEQKPRALPDIYNEMLRESDADIMVILADHVVIRPEAMETVREIFEEKYPDLDGVVGMSVAEFADRYPSAKDAGVPKCIFPAIGREFADRFADRIVFCPEYWHFCADTELGECADHFGRFTFSGEPWILNTFHPAASTASPDATYRASRVNFARDVETWDRRQKAGLLWGCPEEGA